MHSDGRGVNHLRELAAFHVICRDWPQDRVECRRARRPDNFQPLAVHRLVIDHWLAVVNMFEHRVGVSRDHCEDVEHILG